MPLEFDPQFVNKIDFLPTDHRRQTAAKTLLFSGPPSAISGQALENLGQIKSGYTQMSQAKQIILKET